MKITPPSNTAPWVLLLLFPLLANAQEICDNELDDDGDGLIDCFDPDCSGQPGCETFFFGQPVPACEFTPPPINLIDLTELYRTDHLSFPIDQRAGVYVGDMNGDGIPDLVSRDPAPSRIQIFSGDDGRILQSISTGSNHPFGQVAIADVDRDGNGDIFHVEQSERLARYEFGNPDPVWRTVNGLTNDQSVGTPQVADFNADGIPEVYVGGRIFDAITGVLYSSQNVNNGAYAGGSNSDRFPIAHDLFRPGDAKPGGGTFGAEANGLEYIAGDKAYTFTFTPGVAGSGAFQEASRLNNPPSGAGDGFTSIADINGDGRMDVAVMDAGRVYAWDPYTRAEVGSLYNVPGTNGGGRINLGDFNGDGDVELGFAGLNRYVVLELLPDNTFGVLWDKTGVDDGSQRTGSTLFDFDGDGMVEVVYSEEAFLYVYRGTDGAELLRIPSEAGTRTEYPLVADVNGDGTAEIIVTAQNGNGPGFSGRGWITVYTSANQPWVPTRPVWNQHGYNVVNINDDLSVPRVQQNPLNPALIDNYNNFLVQSPIRTQSGVGNYPAADAVINATVVPGTTEPLLDPSNCPDAIGISLEIDNAGAAVLPASTPVAFYQGDPSLVQATLIDVVPIGVTVPAGAMVTVSVMVDVSAFAGSNGPTDVYMVINDPGFAPADLPFDFATDFPVTGTAECDYTNNLTLIGTLSCEEICDDGLDNDGDAFVDEPNLFVPSTSGCPGATLPAFTADVGNNNGTYSIVQPDPSGTTVTAAGLVTLGTNSPALPQTVQVVFGDGNCSDTVTVTIQDPLPPQLVCPGNRTQPADADCMALVPELIAQAQVSDNCSATNAIVLSQSPPAGDPLTLGSNTVTISATDEAGNVATCNTNIEVIDQTDPQLNCVVESPVVTNADCQAVIPDLSAQANATDNCTSGPDLVFVQTPAAGTVVTGSATNTTQTVTLNVRDESNNQSSCSILLRVLDESPPVVSCPPGQSVTLDENCSYAIADFRSQVAKTDNCSNAGEITLVQSPAAGTTLTTATSTTVTITATDAAGNLNATGCSFTVTTQDLSPPFLNCPTTILADADPVNCLVTLADYTGLANPVDNCGGVTVDQSPPPGNTFDANSTVVTLTATDAAGNVSNCDITVQRRDVTPPQLTCPVDQAEVFGADCQFILPDYRSLAGADDNCSSPPTLSQSPAPGTVLTADQAITLTATDAAGLTTSCVFNVTLTDQTPPAITCPSPQVLGVDGTCSVALPDYAGNASTSDNCSTGGQITVTQSPPAGTMYSGDGTQVNVLLTPTDAAGNAGSSCNFTVTLEDMVEPSITCPVSPQVDFLDANCAATVPDFRTAVDVSSMCDATGIQLSQSPPPGTVVTGHNTTTQITITAADGNGNTATCTFDYLVLDNAPPSLTCPAALTEAVDENCAFTLPDYTSQLPALTDNCTAMAQLTLSQDPVPGTTLSGAGTVQGITVTATDQAGNASMCVIELSLNDVTPPVVSCPENIAPLIASATCEAPLPDFTAQSSATDNCDPPAAISLTQNPAPNTVLSGAGSSQVVTITATDASNNSADCSFTVSLEDELAPEISCPADLELTVNSACTANVPNLVPLTTATDNCTPESMILLSQDVAANTTLTGHGTQQLITLTADDGNGNTADCQTTVILVDNSAPIVTCPAAQDFVLNTDCAGLLPDFSGQLQATDNCTPNADLLIGQSPAAGSGVSGANTVVAVTFMVDDNNGNMSTCAFDLRLVDQTPPAVVCPANQTIALDADCRAEIPDYRGSATPTDACTMSGMILLTQSPGVGTSLTGHNQQQMVTITADDGNGNSASCTFQVTTSDTVAPMISCPDNQIVSVDVNCAFDLPDYTAAATLADNCALPGEINVTQTPAMASLTDLDVPVTINLTAQDPAGNEASCTFTVTPTDRTPPGIICPQPRVVYYDAACSVSLPDFTALATPSDNCSATNDLLVTQLPANGTAYANLNPPLVTVTLTAEDESGNTASCDFQVELQDTVRPIISCPNDTVIALDGDCNGQLPDLTTLLLTDDNCSGNSLTVTQSPDPDTQYGGDGTKVILTFTVTDADGNQTTCNSLVTFEDQSPPDPVVCPDNQTLTTDDICPIALPDYTGSVTVLDNCRAEAAIGLTQLPAAGTFYTGNGTVVPVTITANDGNGNTADCNFTVTLVDNVSLNLACPGGQIVIASGEDCTGTLLDYSDQAFASNECMSPAALVTFQQLPAEGTLLTADLLDIPQAVTLEATDLSGNTTSCTFNVTLIDTLAPELTCPANQVQAVDGGCQHLVLDYRDATVVSDNCSAAGDVVLTQSPAPGTVLLGPDRSQEITIVARDESDNVSSCRFVLTIMDTIAPNIVCPEPDTLFVGSDCEVSLPDYASELEKLDNCTSAGDLLIDQSPAPGTLLSGHATGQLVEMTATDGSGNTGNCVVSVYLRDTLPPRINCPGEQVVFPDADCNASLGDYRNLSTQDDNCTPAADITVSQSPAPASLLSGQGAGRQVTLTADDGHGNTQSCTFAVRLDDNVPPTISCPPDTLVMADGDCEFDLPDLRPLTIYADNCTATADMIVTQLPGIGFTLSGAGDSVEAVFTADDSNGNTAQCSYRITLADATPPTILCPATDTLFTDADCQAVVPDYTAQALVQDNCTPVNLIRVSQDSAPGTIVSGSETPRTISLTANDGNGNSSNCAFQLEILDNSAPTVSCPDRQTEFADADCTISLGDFRALAGVEDNCVPPNTAGSLTLTQRPLPGFEISGFNEQLNVTITATDSSGNRDSCVFVVVVGDTLRPVIQCPPDTTIAFGQSCDFSLPDFSAVAMATDNCAASLLTVRQFPAPDTLLSGLNTTVEVSLIVTDGNDNQGSCTFSVTTSSATPPPAPLTVVLARPPTNPGETVSVFDLNDALDPQATANTTGMDLDGDLVAGPGPFEVDFYLTVAEAEMETNRIENVGNFQSDGDGTLIARLEDPTTGCFTLSQVLLIVRESGTSGLAGELVTYCNRAPFVVEIDGQPMPGGPTTTLTHQWTLIAPGTTRITPDRLLNPDEPVLRIDTEGLTTGTFVLEYQFFEDYGNGEPVGSLPARLEVEVLKVGAGDFFWDGRN